MKHVMRLSREPVLWRNYLRVVLAWKHVRGGWEREWISCEAVKESRRES